MHMISARGRTNAVVALAVAALVVTMGGTCAAETLLSASLPGAFGVRYLPDRAVVTYTVEDPGERGLAETFRLRVRLPEQLRWAYLDRELVPEERLRWSPEDSQAVLALPFGTHRVHLGWAGEPALPPESEVIPVEADGEIVGSLQARFELDGMEATGEAAAGPGTAGVRVVPDGPIDPETLSLTVGAQTISTWRRGDEGLEAQRSILIDESPGIALHVGGYVLQSSPVARVAFDNVRPPAQVQRVEDEIPEGAVLVEAEDFVDSGGTEPIVEPGSHYDTHGGACIYTFMGDGSWVEWPMTVAEDGAYDLYARISCGDVGSFRIIHMDGEVPAGLDLVEFPTTGGWGHAKGEWWTVRITGGEGLAPPLQLSAGEHTLRITGVLQKHLNFDYVLLVPHE